MQAFDCIVVSVVFVGVNSGNGKPAVVVVKRFRRRTLLIATTLVAVVLGLNVWLR